MLKRGSRIPFEAADGLGIADHATDLGRDLGNSQAVIVIKGTRRTEAMRQIKLIVGFSLVTVAPASAQPTMTNDQVAGELQRLWLGKICQFIPVVRDKPISLTVNSPATKNFLSYERAGVITIKLLDPRLRELTLSDIASGGSVSTVSLEARLVDNHPEFFCAIGTGKGLNAGTLTLKELVRVQKIQFPGDGGIQTDAYYVAATVKNYPSEVMLRINPTVSRDQKVQAILVYNLIQKEWNLKTGQVVSADEPFSDLMRGIDRSPNLNDIGLLAGGR
jgi:hypothetical protein